MEAKRRVRRGIGPSKVSILIMLESRWSEPAKNLSLLFAAVIFLFLVIEIILRITNFKNLATYTVPCVRETSISGLSAELTPNCSQRGALPYNLGVLMHVNSCGFRGSENECGLLKSSVMSSTVPYVFVTGDSYTNAGNVNEPDTYVKVAESRLRDKIKDAVLFNVGVAAADVDQKMVAARYFLDNYPAKPAAVVYQWLLNDYDPSLDFSKSKGRMTKFKIFLRKYFYTYRFIVNIKYRLVSTVTNSPVTTADLREYRKKEFSQEEAFTKLKDKLCSFSAYLESKDIKRVFLNPALQEMLTDWKDYDEMMENIDKRINSIAEECGWTAVWTTEESKKYPLNDIVLQPTGDHHPNVLGNKIIGEALGNKLQTILQEN